jgi:RNA polymerase sigma-70 factor (ECF subfamily)
MQQFAIRKALLSMAGLTTTGSMTVALQRAVAGDEAAFTQIVAAYQWDMTRVAYGVCGDPELALDAVQTAWLIAWRKLRTVRQPDHLRSWLVAVAANEAREIVRRRHSSSVVELVFDPPDTDAPDPAEEIRELDLRNALHRLKPDERSLIALRYGAELDSNEIGPLLGISASGVRARLARIMGRLRKELDDV